MAASHNRRQRKKLHLGEFQELGFAVTAAFRHSLDAAQQDALIDAFLEECVEANGMMFGGGVGETLRGYLVAEGARASATDAQRETVRAWLDAREEVESVKVDPLSDAWHGHD
jgi:uncharacterized protein YggL (DUF469 family)